MLTRWAALFDTHGDEADKPALEAARAFLADFKPTVRVGGGDHWDFRWLRKSASNDEAAESVTADFEAGLDFLAWYRPTVLTLGNHDMRLWDLLDKPTSGALRHLATQWIDRIEVTLKGCQILPYCKRKGVYRLGDHAVVHGYSHGLGAIRKAALVYGNVIMGHVHRVEAVRVERHDGAWGYGAGCLCRLDFDYARANVGTLAQERGFAYGVITPSGRTIVWQAREIDGTWLFPSELTPTSSPPRSRNSRAARPAAATRARR